MTSVGVVITPAVIGAYQTLAGGLDAVVTTTAQGHYHPLGMRLVTVNTTADRAGMVMTRAGTVKNLRARTVTGGAAGIGAAQTLVVRLHKAGVAQTLQVTLDGDDADGTEQTDLVNSFTVAVGDIITVGTLNSAAGTQRIIWSFDIEAA